MSADTITMVLNNSNENPIPYTHGVAQIQQPITGWNTHTPYHH